MFLKTSKYESDKNGRFFGQREDFHCKPDTEIIIVQGVRSRIRVWKYGDGRKYMLYYAGIVVALC